MSNTTNNNTTTVDEDVIGGVDHTVARSLDADHRDDDVAQKSTVDDGWAWVVLIGVFFGLIITDSFIWSFGIFLVTWQEQISGSVTDLQWIISLPVAIAHLAGPLGSGLCKVFSIRQVVIGGVLLCSVSFIISSFALTAWHLYVTFSFAGLGFGLMYQPSLVILTYYFDKRLARANGIAQTGSGLGLFIIPPLLQVLIDEYGWRGSLLIVSGLVANTAICAALYRPSPVEYAQRRRNSSSAIERDSKRDKEGNKPKRKNIGKSCLSVIKLVLSSIDIQLFTNTRCVCLFVASFLYVMAYTLVLEFLAARAVHAGISELKSAFLLSIIGINSVVTRLTHGYLVDYKIMTGTLLTAIACLINAICCASNPLTNQYSYLAALSSMFGLSSGIANALVPVVAKEYAGVEHVSGAVGILLLTSGSGAIIGSYITGFLFDATNSYDLPFFIAGACFFVASILFFIDPHH